MAEEVKKIITVEVGKSITSVRDFKKHIEDLRGALLGLNEESEEYKTIAEQIATDQAKLNEVMSVGKRNTDAASGSYVELNNQLKSLRQQYKALSETERNGATGQAILQNITKLDTELKNIDESMGQYQRNVGNYKSAFDGAFKTVVSEISKVNPTLGTILSTVEKLVPAFRGVGNAARGAGTSIKTAMASTGIGLLVVALGEIVAHWEQIATWASKALGLQNKYTQAVKESDAEMKKLAKDAEDAARKFQEAYDKARGLTDADIARNQLNNSINALSEFENYYTKGLSDFKNKVDDTFEALDKGNTSTFIEKSKELRGEIANLIDNFDSINYSVSREDLENLRRYLRDLEDTVEEYGNVSSFAPDANTTLYKLKQFYENETALEDERHKELLRQFSENEKVYGEARSLEQAALEKRLNDVDKYGKSEIQLRTEQYEKDKALIKETILDTERRNEQLKRLEEEYIHDIKEIRKKQWESSSSYQELQQRKSDAAELAKSLKDYGKDELQILDENYIAQLTLLEQFGYDTTNLTKKWCEEREKIVKDQYEKDQENQKKQQEKLLQAQKDYLNESLYQQGKGQDWRTIAAESKNTAGKDYKLDIFRLFPGEDRPDIQKEREQVDLIYQIEQQGYMDRIDLYNQFLSQLEEGSQEYLETEKAINQEKMDLATLEYEHDKELQRRIAEDAENRKKIISGMANNAASIWSSITDAILVNEEQGSNKWKAYKTSEAVVNTIAGALSAFMSGVNSNVPAPWNLALAGAMAATTAAAGYAEVRKIQATKMGSANSASGSPTANVSGVGVEPLLNPDYDLQRMTNLSLQSEEFLPGKTQVYVLESDIQEVGNRVQVRENNATF